MTEQNHDGGSGTMHGLEEAALALPGGKSSIESDRHAVSVNVSTGNRASAVTEQVSRENGVRVVTEEAFKVGRDGSALYSTVTETAPKNLSVPSILQREQSYTANQDGSVTISKAAPEKGGLPDTVVEYKHTIPPERAENIRNQIAKIAGKGILAAAEETKAA